MIVARPQPPTGSQHNVPYPCSGLGCRVLALLQGLRRARGTQAPGPTDSGCSESRLLLRKTSPENAGPSEGHRCPRDLGGTPASAFPVPGLILEVGTGQQSGRCAPHSGQMWERADPDRVFGFNPQMPPRPLAS